MMSRSTEDTQILFFSFILLKSRSQTQQEENYKDKKRKQKMKRWHPLLNTVLIHNSSLIVTQFRIMKLESNVGGKQFN